MDSFSPIEATQQPNKRPGILTVFCILTFVGAGLSVLSYLVAIGLTVADPWEAYQIGLPEAGVSFLLLLLAGGRITGAILMMGMKKAGYIIYVCSEGLAFLIGCYVFLMQMTRGRMDDEMMILLGFSFFCAFIGTGLFITIYSTQLKKMR